MIARRRANRVGASRAVAPAVRSLPVLGGLVVLGAVLGGLSLTHYLYAVGGAGALFVLSVVGLWTPRVSRLRPIDDSFRWLPWAWLALFFVSNLKFTISRSPQEAVLGNASLENMFELAVYGVIGLMTAARWPVVQARWRDAVPVLGWAAVALVSALWSITAYFTVLRSVQLFVPILLGVLTARIWRWSPRLGRALWTRAVRLFINVTVGFTLLGFVDRHWWIDGRFTWPGAHPGVSSITMACALLLLLLGGRSVAAYSVIGLWTRATPMIVGLFLGQTRAVLAAVAVAVLVALWMAGPVRPLARYVGLPVYLSVVLLTVIVAGPQLRDYLLRGQSAQYVGEFNGRAELWKIAFDDIGAEDKWVLGFGYGTPRIILSRRIIWAGTAHNAVIELLMGTGLVGLAAGIGAVALVGRGVVRRRRDDLWFRVACGSVLTCLMVASGASSGWTIPSIDLTVLSLVLAYAFSPTVADPPTSRRSAEAGAWGPARSPERGAPRRGTVQPTG